jgi:ribonuclease HI
MIWRHYDRALNNTMELLAIPEAIRGLPEGIHGLVSTDSNHVKHGNAKWNHSWKRNGWKNAKKREVASATVWRELDTAIANQARVEFTWVKAHS